jgi:hypothetical protein
MNFGFAPVQSQPRFEALRRQAALAEAHGFDTLWAHEHHVGGTIYPCPLMTLAAVAESTRRIRLGTNMLLLPLYHPLRVAQEAAMLDVLSGGRLILGVSAGYAADEFHAFGVPLGERGRRMREGVALIRAVWTDDAVTREGASFALSDFSLFPRLFRTHYRSTSGRSLSRPFGVPHSLPMASSSAHRPRGARCESGSPFTSSQYLRSDSSRPTRRLSSIGLSRLSEIGRPRCEPRSSSPSACSTSTAAGDTRTSLARMPAAAHLP